jgi:hypothetical protein
MITFINLHSNLFFIFSSHYHILNFLFLPQLYLKQFRILSNKAYFIIMGDCISECGFGCFIPRKNFLNYHLALASIVSAFLGIMGCVSFNNIADSIANAAWMTGEITNHEDYLFGLSGYAVKEHDKNVYRTVLYSDNTKCVADFCKTCYDARTLVLSLLVVALLFGFLSFACSLKRTFNDTSMWKTCGILSSLICMALGSSAYNMHQKCFDQVDTDGLELATSIAETTGEEVTFTYGYGSGAVQVLISFAIAAYICLFNLLIPVASSADEKDDDEEED